MTARVVLASGNAKKLVELRRILVEGGLAIEVLGLADVPGYPEPAETEPTFEGNALLKARACCRATGLPALADDSGLSVDVLNQMPGVRSARWAGPGRGDDANNALLLAQLEDVEPERRTARFRCAMALVLPDGREEVRTGEMSGRVIDELRGEQGFGYDPLFVPDGHDRSTAEMTATEKDAISHRGHALRQLLPVLAEALT